ncbi:MAG: hypothetical protein EXS05_02740 [Planctomycetaceae bacterium]|nr:hypothetical protein [Planctomycetaceae bacterium]
MSLSFNPTAFDLAAGLLRWLIVMSGVMLIVGISLTLMSLVAVGKTGPLMVVGQIRDGFIDFLGTSPRRVWALTVLTFREAFRRKTLVVFGVFAVLFLFAGWFMSGVTTDPTLQFKAYVSFVLRTISWLILPVVLLLACWGLPEDIRARSLHTVVTKPVRRQEVVLGRIFGFSMIGLLVLAVVGIIGYVWIVRQMGQTPAMRAQLVARVPIYGYKDVLFLDKEGRDKDERGEILKAGINVGDELPFRSFIEGSTQARAIWNFENFSADRLDQGRLIFESSFQSFRTHKGNIEKGLLCQLTLVNVEKNIRVPLQPFIVDEFRRNTYDVTEKNQKGLTDLAGRPVNLAKDLLHDGKLRVEVACLSSQQFLGMARPDLFIRLPDKNFASSYFKSLFSIGLMVITVVVLGVTSGCFVKGPVATLLTAFVVIVGRMARSFMEEVATGDYKDNPQFKMQGRGILDSLIRIPTHKSPTVALDDNWINKTVQLFDNLELAILWAVHQVFPDLGTFDTTEYTANAFDVPFYESLLPSLAVTVGFCVPLILIGYYSLKLRELEAK